MISSKQSFLLLGSSRFDSRQLSRALLDISLPHGLEPRQQLQICFPVLIEVLLHNQGPFIEAPGFQVQNVMPYLEVLDGLLVAVQHHQAAADVVLEDGVVNRFDFQG